MARNRKLIGCVLAVASSAIPAWATTYTSASYVQDGRLSKRVPADGYFNNLIPVEAFFK